MKVVFEIDENSKDKVREVVQKYYRARGTTYSPSPHNPVHIFGDTGLLFKGSREVFHPDVYQLILEVFGNLEGAEDALLEYKNPDEGKLKWWEPTPATLIN